MQPSSRPLSLQAILLSTSPLEEHSSTNSCTVFSSSHAVTSDAGPGKIFLRLRCSHPHASHSKMPTVSQSRKVTTSTDEAMRSLWREDTQSNTRTQVCMAYRHPFRQSSYQNLTFDR
ncbi:hypothetical protein DENSPDRAFT_845810 [Dentipellis sp. KUC8613]|nr:hypothetical protein DENSPDRAFT_845810 [Dentipellis sp. KUC8613]